MNKCPHCGAENDAGAKFCGSCGKPFPQDKECPECGARVKMSFKFCPECGHNFGAPQNSPNSDRSGSMPSVGDKNVIAGDVVGSQEIIKVAGAATIVKNEDETKKVVTCRICGRKVVIADSVECRRCGKVVCEKCFDHEARLCRDCVSSDNADRENSYRQELEKALADGKITPEERQGLIALRKKLDISQQRAAELEREVRNTVSPQNTGVSVLARTALRRAESLLYDRGNAAEAYDLLKPLYERYSGDEEILSLFLAAAMKVDPEQAQKLIGQLQADILGVRLVQIDRALEDREVTEAEGLLENALGAWPDDFLLKCRYVMLVRKFYDRVRDPELLDRAVEILSSLEDAKNKMERSWLARAQFAVWEAMGDEIPDATPDYCKENDLFFFVVNSGGDAFYRLALTLEDAAAKSGGKEFFRMLRLAAAEGSVPAHRKLGDCFRDGIGTAKDAGQAVEWYRKAAEQGDAKAQSSLGCCYHDGNGVEQNYSEAVRWIRKAAEQGDAEAQNNLGFCYHYSNGVEQNYSEAVKWYRRAVEQGNDAAQNNLGLCYYNGNGVEQNYSEAAKYFRKAAEQGNAHAQCSLGTCYYNGRGVEQDHAEAAKWYRKAAEQGLAGAQCNLGECYHSGVGVEQNYAEAVKWYRRAAEQGHVAAQNNLGGCYLHGFGVEQDHAEAAKWYRKAAEQGFAWAQYNLGVCYYDGKGVDQDHAEAAKWYRKAAEQGNGNAKLELKIMGL